MEETTEITAQQETQEPDWKAEYEKVKPIVERAESLEKQYKSLQRELNKARTEHVSKADIAALEERLAAALDAMSPDEDDEPKRKLRPSEVLRAARPKEEPKPEYAPEFAAKLQQAERLMKRLGYSDAQQDQIVHEYPDIDDALEELEKRRDAQIQKAAEESALQTFRQGQKASGATKGDGVPSASSLNDEELRRKFIENPDDPKISRDWLAIRDSFYARKNRGG